VGGGGRGLGGGGIWVWKGGQDGYGWRGISRKSYQIEDHYRIPNSIRGKGEVLSRNVTHCGWFGRRARYRWARLTVISTRTGRCMQLWEMWK